VKRLNIGIVGAGFAGAAAALFLAERGHRVRVYEEAPEPEPVGAGILMQPSGLSVLCDLGLLEGAIARGSRVDALECITPSGSRILDLSYRDLYEGWFGLGMHRGALFELLHEQLPRRGVELVTGASVQAARSTRQGNVWDLSRSSDCRRPPCRRIGTVFVRAPAPCVTPRIERGYAQSRARILVNIGQYWGVASLIGAASRNSNAPVVGPDCAVHDFA
jgi:phytoene dehydrogenase-like protein